MSVGFVGLGVALGAVFIAYGPASEAMWPLIAAIASAIAGFVLTWLYQRRERPMQIAEDSGRAGELVHSFESRLEIGPGLVFTDYGIELREDTLAWHSIRSIDASLPDAMMKQATILLDGAGPGRRRSLSLGNLSEQPSVAYAVMKMLWRRHSKARELPAIHRPSLAFPRTGSTLGTVWGAIGAIAFVAGFIASGALDVGNQPWLAALPAGAGIALCFFAFSRATRADWRKAATEQERVDAMQSSIDSSHEEVVIRRKVARAWPAIITAVFAAPAAIFFAMGETPLAAVFLMVGSVVALVAWLIAWWMGSGAIAKLTSKGIVVRGEAISWNDIASVDLNLPVRMESGLLVLRLARPRAPRTVGERINSSLSRGTSDEEIVVSLARSEEPAAVILELAEARWRRAIGDARADAAVSKQLATAIRRTRTWSQFTYEEKSRTLKVAFVIFAVLGLCVHGVETDFQMSDRWFLVSLIASGVLTLAGTVALLRAGVFISLRNQHGTASYLAFLLLVAAMTWMVFWSALGLSLPGMGTQVLGLATVSDTRYDKQHFPRSDSCPYPLSIYLDRERPFRFCASPADFASLPAEGTLQLRVRESWFGIHIVNVSSIGN